MLFSCSYSQQYRLYCSDKYGEYNVYRDAFNSKIECENAIKERESNYRKMSESFAEWNTATDNYIQRVYHENGISLPTISLSIDLKLSCKCVPLSGNEQTQTGQKPGSQYTPLMYQQELAKLFDNPNLKNLAEKVPELQSLWSDLDALGKRYERPSPPKISDINEIDSRADEIDLEEEFDMEANITNISSVLDNLIENIPDDISEEDLSALMKEIELLEAIYAKLLESRQIKEQQERQDNNKQ